MNSTTKLAIGLMLSTLTVGELSAQWNIVRTGAQRNFGYASVALDPAVIASAGYVRTVSVFGHDVQLGAEGGIVAAGWDARDFRGRAQVRTSLLHVGILRVIGSAAFIARGTENSLHRAFNFGSDFTGTAGLYRRGWFLAGEFGFDKAIITHITHSDWYRRNVYAGAQDGWYLTGGGTFHYGVTGGLTIGQAEVAVRAGLLRTEDFNELVTPGYATASLGFRF
jgi:hypothetical protein